MEVDTETFFTNEDGDAFFKIIGEDKGNYLFLEQDDGTIYKGVEMGSHGEYALFPREGEYSYEVLRERWTLDDGTVDWQEIFFEASYHVERLPPPMSLHP